MPICFILIGVEPGRERNVYNKLSKSNRIIEHHLVSGEYDIIAKIKVDNPKSLLGIIKNEVRSIPGVKNTRTLTRLELD